MAFVFRSCRTLSRSIGKSRAGTSRARIRSKWLFDGTSLLSLEVCCLGGYEGSNNEKRVALCSRSWKGGSGFQFLVDV